MDVRLNRKDVYASIGVGFIMSLIFIYPSLISSNLQQQILYISIGTFLTILFTITPIIIHLIMSNLNSVAIKRVITSKIFIKLMFIIIIGMAILMTGVILDFYYNERTTIVKNGAAAEACVQISQSHTKITHYSATMQNFINNKNKTMSNNHIIT